MATVCPKIVDYCNGMSLYLFEVHVFIKQISTKKVDFSRLKIAYFFLKIISVIKGGILYLCPVIVDGVDGISEQ